MHWQAAILSLNVSWYWSFFWWQNAPAPRWKAIQLEYVCRLRHPFPCFQGKAVSSTQISVGTLAKVAHHFWVGWYIAQSSQRNDIQEGQRIGRTVGTCCQCLDSLFSQSSKWKSLNVSWLDSQATWIHNSLLQLNGQVHPWLWSNWPCWCILTKPSTLESRLWKVWGDVINVLTQIDEHTGLQVNCWFHLVRVS